MALAGIWEFGFLGITVSWLARWRRIHAAVRAGTSLKHLLEPGVFGIVRPVLLLPEGIEGHLTPAQLDLIVAHEMCHARRGDNLTAAIHMAVETIFWFHPIVWWIGNRLVEERERCCDEEVLKVASDPKVYAEGILNVCKFYLSSPLACASGVSGADLKKRIESIMANRVRHSLNLGRKILLISTGLIAIAGPVAIGVPGARSSRGQSQAASATFDVASVKSNRSGGHTTRKIDSGRITYIDITLGEFIRMAYGLSFNQLSGPNWAVEIGSADRYDVLGSAAGPASKEELMLMLRTLLVERFHLVFHRESRQVPVYALVVAKGGPKFNSSDGGAMTTVPDTAPDGTPGFLLKNWTMSSFANSLSIINVVGRPVLDRTGLEGSYTFKANLSDRRKQAASGADSGGSVVPDSDALFSTLQELGLKLESRKEPVEFFVIDHADKLPVAN